MSSSLLPHSTSSTFLHIPVSSPSVILISSETSFPLLWELADSEGHHPTLIDSSSHKQHPSGPLVSAVFVTCHFFYHHYCYFPSYCRSSSWFQTGVKVQLFEFRKFYSLGLKTKMTVIKRRTNCFFISLPLGNQADIVIKVL